MVVGVTVYRRAGLFFFSVIGPLSALFDINRRRSKAPSASDIVIGLGLYVQTNFRLNKVIQFKNFGSFEYLNYFNFLISVQSNKLKFN